MLFFVLVSICVIKLNLSLYLFSPNYLWSYCHFHENLLSYRDFKNILIWLIISIISKNAIWWIFYSHVSLVDVNQPFQVLIFLEYWQKSDSIRWDQANSHGWALINLPRVLDEIWWWKSNNSRLQFSDNPTSP